MAANAPHEPIEILVVEIDRFFELMRAIEGFRLRVVKVPAAGGGRKAA